MNIFKTEADQVDDVATHGLAISNTDPAGVHREVSIYRLKSGNTAITISTSVVDAEPVVTRFAVSPIAMFLLRHALAKAEFEINDFPVADDSKLTEGEL